MNNDVIIPPIDNTGGEKVKNIVRKKIRRGKFEFIIDIDKESGDINIVETKEITLEHKDQSGLSYSTDELYPEEDEG